jgi:photosystem II stability/assembly factor-like uncharacterized protein
MNKLIVIPFLAIVISASVNFSHGASVLDSLAISAIETSHGKIFAAAYRDPAVYCSADSGRTWQTLSPRLPIDTTSPLYGSVVRHFEFMNDTVYVATQRGVFRSSVNFIDWQPVSNGLDTLDVMVIDAFDDALYAGTRGGIFKFNKDGLSWTRLSNGLPAPGAGIYCQAMTHCDGMLFAQAYGGVFASTDDGASWSNLSNNPVTLSSDVQVLPTGDSTYYSKIWASFLSASGATLIAATMNGAVYRSGDRGRTWTMVMGGCTYCSMPIIEGLYTDSITMFIGKYYHKIIASRDAGIHWDTTGSRPAYCFTRLGDYVAAGTEFGIYFTKDDFRTTSPCIPSSFTAIARKNRGFPSASENRVVTRTTRVSVYDASGRRLKFCSNGSRSTPSIFSINIGSTPPCRSKTRRGR